MKTHTSKPLYYFVIGLPRTGSTLLSFVLNAHSKIHVEHEDSALPFHDRDDREIYNLEHKIKIGFQKYLDDFPTNGKILVTTRYDHKNEIKLIAQALGDQARYIIFTRANSWRIFYRVDKQPRAIKLREIWDSWVCKNYIKKNFEYVEVSYTDMIAKPKQAFAKICKFMRVDFEPETLDYHKFDHKNLSGRGNEKVRKFKGIVDKSAGEKLTAGMVYNALTYRAISFIKSAVSILKKRSKYNSN